MSNKKPLMDFLKSSVRQTDVVENPYLNARRATNDINRELINNRRGWQLVSILALLIALAAVGGIEHIGSQSKFIPYIVEVDKLGQAVAAGPADHAQMADSRVVHSFVTRFITDFRLVTLDTKVQGDAIRRVFSMLSEGDPATTKAKEFYNTESLNPLRRAAHEMVNIEISSALPQSPDTWQVDWVETIRDRDGVIRNQPFNMRALLTIYLAPPSANTPEEEINKNPLGIYVKDYSWSKLL